MIESMSICIARSMSVNRSFFYVLSLVLRPKLLYHLSRNALLRKGDDRYAVTRSEKRDLIAIFRNMSAFLQKNAVEVSFDTNIFLV